MGLKSGGKQYMKWVRNASDGRGKIRTAKKEAGKQWRKDATNTGRALIGRKLKESEKEELIDAILMATFNE